MKPAHISTDGAAAVYLLAASEGAFIGAASVLVLLQRFSLFAFLGAGLGAIAGILFARRYKRSNVS